MAGNKPFANLDRLASLARPTIVPFNPNIQQGGPTKPIPIDVNIDQGSSIANKTFNAETSLGNRYEQRSVTNTTHLAQFFLSDTATNVTNSRFRTSISLADRVDQPGLGTTNHLSQFFLSDVFTGVIRIKTPPQSRVGVVNIVNIGKPSEEKSPQQQGGTLPQQIKSTPQQGSGESPFLPIKDISTKQGIITQVNGSPGSDITLLFPRTVNEKFIEQGGFVLSNGDFVSSVEVQSIRAEIQQGSTDIKVSEPEEIQQGGTDINPPKSSEIEQGGTDIKPPKPKEVQQGGQEPVLTKTAEEIQAAQGIIVKGSSITSSIIPDRPVEKVDQGIVSLGSAEQSSISILLPPPFLNQGYVGVFGVNLPESITVTQAPASVSQGSGTSPTLPSGEITNIQVPNRQGSSDLNTLSFTLGGLLLRTNPELYQGGNFPTNELSGEGGHQIVDARAAKVSILLNPPKGTVAYDKAQMVTGIPAAARGGSLEKYNNANKAQDGTYINIEEHGLLQRNRRIMNVLNTPVVYDDAALTEQIGDLLADTANGQRGGTLKYAQYFKEENKSSDSTVRELVDSDGQLNKNVAIGDALAATGDTTEVANKVLGIVRSKITPDRIKDYKAGFDGSTSYQFYQNTTDYDQIVQSSQASSTSDQVRPTTTIQVSSIEDASSVVIFDAFIKTFSDNFNASYQDFKHIGQMDTFKVYTGATRQISLAFSAVAMKGTKDFRNSDMNARDMLKDKINNLATICTVGGVNGIYVTGPVVRVTIAGLVSGLICACTSVKVDVPITDTTWDVDTYLPHNYDVSLDLSTLAMADDKLLYKKGIFYNVGS